jgi:hypothetical protein
LKLVEATYLLRRRLLDTEPDDIKSRQEYERQHRCHRQTAHDGVSHRSPKDGRGDRDHAKNGGRCREKDWAKAMQGRFNDSVPWGPAVRDFGIDLVY